MHAAYLDDQIIAARGVFGSPLLPAVAAAPRSLRPARLAADLGTVIDQPTPPCSRTVG